MGSYIGQMESDNETEAINEIGKADDIFRQAMLEHSNFLEF
ncbi:MAG: hypothetical protein ABIR84_07170 [Candidatus Nitrotoga sp.]